MERVTTKEAAKLLNMDVVTLQFLMRQDRLPIGYAIKKDGKSRYHYIIYKSMLDAFIQGGGKRLNGRKTILLVEIAGRFLSGTDYQTTANFAGGR